MISAVVPVKSLAASKSRLIPRLGRPAAERLAVAMLGDVVEALRGVRGLARVVVATPDVAVARAAREAGAQALLRPDPGLNEAIEAAGAELAPGPGDGLLVVLGDVAGARPEELEALLHALDGPGVALAPSRDGGTSALLRVPRDAIPAGFGPGSAKVHRDLAARAGCAFRELALPSLAIDVDAPDDLAALRRAGTAGPRTRRLLDELEAAAERAAGAAAPDEIRLVALRGVPPVRAGDDLAALLAAAARAQGLRLAGGVLVVCQKVVSKAEGRLVPLASVTPSAEARRIASEDGKDPRHVEIVLRESARIVRRGPGVLICETRHGFVCANAGVDLSNAPEDGVAVLLPEDPDASAVRLRAALAAAGAEPLAVVVSDTFGRPWREGLVDVAIGCAGIAPIDDLRGRPDLAGRILQVTAMATADQLAAAAGMLMTKDSGVPAVWVDGLATAGTGSLRSTLRDPALDLFR
jgi:coenzyme F420-0:L-glutamate ligase/coenzyme F420-1:gamma-L-glutamate ligase